ncbi:hypothetical protein H6F67_00830 [Microcoleus sp. FACHB-1515]|uniref:hypothetical protein n=1 Tax=Cyanophyceae TaxID=3028117 RepID=UPI0016887BE6|nr:hypothetical protein [Microcoleus sp. FACHB-1515]MBD2088417.1 hypothetical protein [Microcoleus sp. FACHB-1515]
MSLSRCLLSSAVLAGTVFCGMTLPLAAFGSKPVTIQLEEKPVFVGQVEEFAAPYIGLATAISLAAGAASLATSGWRQSSRKLSQTETQMSTLKQQLSEKEALIEDIKFSQQRLSTSGLELFLQEDESPLPTVLPVSQSATPVATAQDATSYMVINAEQPQQAANAGLLTLNAEPQSIDSAPAVKQPAMNAAQLQAMSALASAQAFAGFARSTQTATPAVQPEDTVQLQELMAHLKQVMAQVERMQIGSSASQASSPAWQQQRLAS